MIDRDKLLATFINSLQDREYYISGYGWRLFKVDKVWQNVWPNETTSFSVHLYSVEDGIGLRYVLRSFFHDRWPDVDE